MVTVPISPARYRRQPRPGHWPAEPCLTAARGSAPSAAKCRGLRHDGTPPPMKPTHAILKGGAHEYADAFGIVHHKGLGVNLRRNKEGMRIHQMSCRRPCRWAARGATGRRSLLGQIRSPDGNDRAGSQLRRIRPPSSVAPAGEWRGIVDRRTAARQPYCRLIRRSRGDGLLDGQVRQGNHVRVGRASIAAGDLQQPLSTFSKCRWRQWCRCSPCRRW